MDRDTHRMPHGSRDSHFCEVKSVPKPHSVDLPMVMVFELGVEDCGVA